jgi:hypothetical protein
LRSGKHLDERGAAGGIGLACGVAYDIAELPSPIVTSPPSRPRLLLLPGVGILLGVAYFFGSVIPGAVADASKGASKGFGLLSNWDLETYFLPKFVFGSEEIFRGVLPLWNRFELGGIPFLATVQPAALYLPKVLAFGFLDPDPALRLFLVGHFLLMGGAFLLFAQDQGLGRLGAFAGALLFAFHPFFLLFVTHPVVIASLAWVPLIFLAAERVGRKPGPTPAAALAMLVAIQLTAGYPEFALDCGVLVALHAVVRHRTGAWETPPWQTIPILAAAFLAGAMLAGLQTLPLVDLLASSQRFARATEVEPLMQSASWSALFVIPPLLGFACVALGRRHAAPLWGTLACLLLALGGWRLIRMIPGFSAVRTPWIWVLLFPFFVAWLVACTANRPAGGPARLGRIARLAIAVPTLCWAAFCLARTLLPLGLPEPLTDFPVLAASGGVEASRLASVLGMLGGLTIACFVVGPSRLRDSPSLCAAGLALLVAGQVSAFPYGRPFSRLAVPDSPYRSTLLIPEVELREGRILSLFDVRGGFNLLDRVENVFGREGSLSPPRFGRLERRLGAFVQMLKLDWEQLGKSPGLLDTLDVRFVVAPTRRAKAFDPLRLPDTGWGDRYVTVLRNAHPLGRAWVAYGVTVARSEEDALERVLAPDFDPRRQVILETATRGHYPASSALPPTPVTVRRFAPTLIELDVKTDRPGILVLADSCFPGWKVTVDGEPRELLCANYLVRGVELKEGHHLVQFSYKPASVRWGALASGGAAIVILAIFGRATLRARKAR